VDQADGGCPGGAGLAPGRPGAHKGLALPIHQIGNACGSIGLLHALLNLPPDTLSPDCTLTRFYQSTLTLDKDARAKELETTDFFTKAHEQAAQAGQSTVPVTEEEIDTDLHFIAFVKAKGKDGWVAVRVSTTGSP
jgi:hypothetical protein